MIKKLIIYIFIFIIMYSAVSIKSLVFAHFEKYPPYTFKDGPYKHLEDKPILGLLAERDTASVFQEGYIYAEIDASEDGIYFILKDGDLILQELERSPRNFPDYVYWTDINNSGLKDFIVMYCDRGVGLAAYGGLVEIYLKSKTGSYTKISYHTLHIDEKDFVDMDGDGNYKVIITDMHGSDSRGKGRYHNYFTYNIYEFSAGRLINAGYKYKDFPKFVWITNDPNDKNTTHLTEKEKQAHTYQKDDLIKHESITSKDIERAWLKQCVNAPADVSDKDLAAMCYRRISEIGGIGGMFSSRSATEWLLAAILMDPDNKQYWDDLVSAYDGYWAYVEFESIGHGDDVAPLEVEIEKERHELKLKVEQMVTDYRARKNE
jgi:hypothetical protein